MNQTFGEVPLMEIEQLRKQSRRVYLFMALGFIFVVAIGFVLRSFGADQLRPLFPAQFSDYNVREITSFSFMVVILCFGAVAWRFFIEKRLLRTHGVLMLTFQFIVYLALLNMWFASLTGAILAADPNSFFIDRSIHWDNLSERYEIFYFYIEGSLRAVLLDFPEIYNFTFVSSFEHDYNNNFFNLIVFTHRLTVSIAVLDGVYSVWRKKVRLSLRAHGD